MTAWAVGTELGPYTLVARIGAGGMGEVWKARDGRLDRFVAIKRLTQPHNHRFAQEARSIAALNHPHICQIYDIGPDYLVLEYIEGAPPRGPLRTGETVRLALQMISALEEAHRVGIIHRDLKPSNVLLTASGSLKLLDFGLATRAEPDSDATRTSTGTIVGTPAYMAPEQAEGHAVDVRSDVFSLGAVLYELVAGARAFPGENTAQILSAVLRDEPKPLATEAGLASVVRRCLEKEPSRRFQTMGEIRAALEQSDRTSSAPPPPHVASIAVLPMANLSADKENEYFSDGLTDEIINALARIPRLRVTARTSAFAFRGKEQDIRRIADVLDVRTVLEGSIRRSGNRIRVTVRLVNARDGYQLWSERYDREVADVFAIQDEIAQAIATALRVKLSALRSYVPTFPAYEAYLAGQYHRFKLTPESVSVAQRYYEQSIALDPGYALPHAALGTLFASVAYFGFMPPHVAMPLARTSADRALSLDSSMPEAHATLGEVAALYDYDWSEARQRFQLAMAREPVSASARVRYNAYLIPMNRAADGVEALREAVAEDPLNVVRRHILVWMLMFSQRVAEAATEARRIIDLNGQFYLGHFDLGMACLEQGNVVDALASVERATSLAPWDAVPRAVCAGLLKLAGHDAQANDYLRRVSQSPTYRLPVAMFLFHAVAGEVEPAAEWAEKAIEERAPAFASFLPFRANILRASSRWPALARMMNLPSD